MMEPYEVTVHIINLESIKEYVFFVIIYFDDINFDY